MKVRDLMTTPVRTVSADATVRDAVELMALYGVGALPVTIDDLLAGILTDRDVIIRCIEPRLPVDSTEVARIMTCDPAFVSPDDSVDIAAWIFMGRRVQRLPVVERGRAVGIVTLDDIARLWDDDREIVRMVRRVAPRNKEGGEPMPARLVRAEVVR